MNKEKQREELFALKRALAIARNGKRKVCPNPQVGAVLLSKGKVAAKGWHASYGSEHAEVDLLNKLKVIPSDAVMYVTLEPCNHSGETPPCTKAIIQSGIKEVVFGMRDPNSEVVGGGEAKLLSSGVSARESFLVNKVEEFYRPWRFSLKFKRPYVYALFCLSLDAKVLGFDEVKKDYNEVFQYFEKRKSDFDLVCNQAVEVEKIDFKKTQTILSLDVEANRKLFQEGRVNELIIVHFPMIYGKSGKTFLNQLNLEDSKDIRLLSTRRFKKVAISRYEVLNV